MLSKKETGGLVSMKSALTSVILAKVDGAEAEAEVVVASMTIEAVVVVTAVGVVEAVVGLAIGEALLLVGPLRHLADVVHQVLQI